ncbi:MAG: hypothetical protein AAFO29_00250 [Actinomycetota bacterium]
MNDDDRFPEPSPVAEYRDPELVRRFEREAPPQHGPGFWSELEARLAPASAGTEPAAGRGTEPGHPDGPDDTDDSPTTLLGPAVAEPIELVPGSTGTRWGTGRWLAVAAATIAVVGLGGAALITQGQTSSPVESAAPNPDVEPSDDDASLDQEATASSTVTTAAPRTTTTMAVTSTTVATTVVDQPVDYFGDAAQVTSIGSGRAMAFSPDGSALLVLDDAPGVTSGCEGAELLALYSQDLATGERRPAMGPDARIETGGLDLRIDPFGATPDEVGTRPIYGQEWCDGELSGRWRGVLARDGQISMLDPVEAGSSDDPFAAEASAGSGGGPVLVSPDGSHALALTEIGPQIVSIDGDRPADDAGGGSGSDDSGDADVVSLPDDVTIGVVTAGAWSPDGQAVALSAEGVLLLWSPWTGERQRFDADPANELLFDPSGGRLALVGSGRVTVLTFGDRSEPVPATPRCSGAIEFDPLTASALAGQRLPAEVADTVVAIDAAAATCDWDSLAKLAPDDFIASLGGGDPVELWERSETEGGSPMWYLRTLFRQPNVVTTIEDGAVHLWPAIHQDDDCTLDEAERASAIALGLDPTAAEESCVAIGGYAGYRTTIGADGVWRSFLAGD